MLLNIKIYFIKSILKKLTSVKLKATYKRMNIVVMILIMKKVIMILAVEILIMIVVMKINLLKV